MSDKTFLLKPMHCNVAQSEWDKEKFYHGYMMFYHDLVLSWFLICFLSWFIVIFMMVYHGSMICIFSHTIFSAETFSAFWYQSLFIKTKSQPTRDEKLFKLQNRVTVLKLGNTTNTFYIRREDRVLGLTIITMVTMITMIMIIVIIMIIMVYIRFVMVTGTNHRCLQNFVEIPFQLLWSPPEAGFTIMIIIIFLMCWWSVNHS